jgi:hypothetical protein
VTRRSCQPIQAANRRNIPPRVDRIVLATAYLDTRNGPRAGAIRCARAGHAITSATFATPPTIKCIFGRPTARCSLG